jgi:hypothetical protein
MRKKIAATLALTAGVGLLASVAFATHNEPAKAKGLKMELVTGYSACTSPNKSTPGLGIPACSPPVRNDSVCGFDGGKGSVKAKVITGDIKLQAKAKGLSAGCEGQTLCPVVSFRVTTDNCVPGSVDCTAVDLTNFQVGFPPAGCCVVSGGACKIKTTLNSNLPGAVSAGNRAGIEIHGCGLQRSSASGPAFTCGLFVP